MPRRATSPQSSARASATPRADDAHFEMAATAQVESECHDKRHFERLRRRMPQTTAQISRAADDKAHSAGEKTPVADQPLVLMTVLSSMSTAIFGGIVKGPLGSTNRTPHPNAEASEKIPEDVLCEESEGLVAFLLRTASSCRRAARPRMSSRKRPVTWMVREATGPLPWREAVATASSMDARQKPTSGRTTRRKLRRPRVRCISTTVVVPCRRTVRRLPSNLSRFARGTRRSMDASSLITTRRPRNGMEV